MNADSRWIRALFVIATGAVMAAYGYVAFRSIVQGPSVRIPLKPLKQPEKHVASQEMIRQAGELADRPAPPFSAVDGQGGTHDSRAIFGHRPVVLVFIKNGCPCSVSAQPFFDKIAKAIGEDAEFLGVIDGTTETAKAWGEKYRVRIPILADPEVRIVRDYGAESSVYVVLIGQDGKIARVWPGHSRDMLRELVSLLEAGTGRKVGEIDFDDAPMDLMAGCPFDLP
jgi:peroxiredoxin